MSNLNSEKLKNKILAVIPARGGSKGIPNKNLFPLNGKPLIDYSILECMKSNLITDIVVSTDSIEIKKRTEIHGLKVPFMRPKELATDTALAIPTVIHSVKEIEKIKNIKFNYIIMIQPTAPLRTSIDIDESLDLLIQEGTDSVISVVDVDNYHPAKMKLIKKNRLYDYENTGLENPARQSLPQVYIVNGAIYAMKRDCLIHNKTFKGKSCLPYVMPRNRSVNIDERSDFLVAEYYLSNKN